MSDIRSMGEGLRTQRSTRIARSTRAHCELGDARRKLFCTFSCFALDEARVHREIVFFNSIDLGGMSVPA